MSRSIAAFGLLLAATSAAYANPAGLVPGGTTPVSDKGAAQDRVDVFTSVDYAYEQDSSSVWREQVGAPGTDPNGPLPVSRDLAFKQTSHTITPRVAVGVFHDTFLYAALPIVVAQSRELKLDQGVTAATSSTLADGILPMGGFDAQDPTTPPGGDLVFRGVGRHGLDQVHVGLGIAPMNQRRDDTKPTWKLGAEVRISIGGIMKFDPTAPGANTGVSSGVHEVRVWTSFDRRMGWAEPWLNLWWQAPLQARSGSLFQDPGFGATNTEKSQQAGAEFGFEAYALDDAHNQNRISLDLGTRLVAHFEGRDYSEMWEAFAYAGDSRGMGPLILDADPTRSGIQAMSHPGISNIENYLESAARFALRAQLGPRVRFAVLGDIVWKTDHVISFADAGVDLPTCAAGQTSGCETDPNNLVTPGTSEVNPLHVQRIDLVGHRFRSQDNLGVIIGVQGMLLF